MKAAGEKPGRICNYQVRQLLLEKIYTHKDGLFCLKYRLGPIGCQIVFFPLFYFFVDKICRNLNKFIFFRI